MARGNSELLVNQTVEAGPVPGGAVEILPSRRVQANRENARNSTGPRSAEGKSRSAQNSLKHSILAREVVATRGDGRENPADFHRLHEGLRDDLAPQGTLEGLLVERAAVAMWRLARVLRAETAAIERQIENAQFASEQEDQHRVFELDDDNVEPAERIQDLPGIESVLEMVHAVQSQIEADGFLDAEQLAQFRHVVGYAFRDMEEPEGRCSKAAARERKTRVLEALGGLERDFESRRRKFSRRDARALERAPRLLAVPDEATADRLLRYESAIERQLFRALHELERLQRMRAGELVPPRLHVEVNTRG